MVAVYIVAASDAERDDARRLRWGDHWFKESLSAALREMGHTVTATVADADVLINCHGCGVERLPEHTYNVLWIIGHPDRITVAECWQYDAVYSESERFAEHLRGQGVACTHLPGASDFVPMPDVKKVHGKVFVGNARNGKRPCIEALKGNYKGLAVWGEGWEKLPHRVWHGLYYPHEQLNLLYAQAHEVLNDSHPDMERRGFTNPRAYDMQAVAGGKVPTFAECAGHIMDPIPEEREMLDLGCGQRLRRGFVGLDKAGDGAVKAWDLEMGLPPGIFGARVIIADNILEHIRNLVPLLNDCHRHLSSLRGRLHVTVPNVVRSIEAAFADPDHKRYFTPATFDYFNGEHPRWQEYGQQYGILPWRVVYVRERERFIEAMLRPAKGEEERESIPVADGAASIPCAADCVGPRRTAGAEAGDATNRRTADWQGAGSGGVSAGQAGGPHRARGDTGVAGLRAQDGAVTITEDRIANSRAYGDHDTVVVA